MLTDESNHGLAVEIPTNHCEIPGSTPGRYNLQIEITSLQAIADSMGDTTQTEDVTVHGFSILPKLDMGANSSPLDGVILKVL